MTKYILKCSACGATINVKPGETICKCEYCDTKYKVPFKNQSEYADSKKEQQQSRITALDEKDVDELKNSIEKMQKMLVLMLVLEAVIILISISLSLIKPSNNDGFEYIIPGMIMLIIIIIQYSNINEKNMEYKEAKLKLREGAKYLSPQDRAIAQSKKNAELAEAQMNEIRASFGLKKKYDYTEKKPILQPTSPEKNHAIAAEKERLIQKAVLDDKREELDKLELSVEKCKNMFLFSIKSFIVTLIIAEIAPHFFKGFISILFIFPPLLMFYMILGSGIVFLVKRNTYKSKKKIFDRLNKK